MHTIRKQWKWKCRCVLHSPRWRTPAQFYLLECSWLRSGVFSIVFQFCIVSGRNIHCHGVIETNVFSRDDIIFARRIFDIEFSVFSALRCAHIHILTAFDVCRKCAASSKNQFHK